MSTPINQIRRNAEQQPNMPMADGINSDSQLVEDILREMGDNPGLEQQTDINSQSYQYATDQAQVPAYKYVEPTNPEPAYDVSNRVYQQQQDKGFLGQMGITLSGDSIKDKVIRNIKYPGLVFVICFILSLPEFNRFLFGFVPRLLLESGQISIGGVLLKAVLGMVLFALFAFFI
jgi:hypothetical protein